MKRLAAVLLALAATAGAEALMSKVTVSATSQTVTLNSGEALIINDDDSDSVWVRIFTPGETPAPATAVAPTVEIKAGEGFNFPRTTGVQAISLVTASGTAEVRIIYW